MAKLPAVVDKLDTVPEGQRELYVEQGGKYVLDVDVEQHPATSGLRTKRDELLGRLTKAKPLFDLLGDRTPEEIQADLELAAKAREHKAKAEGDFESLRTQMAEKHQKEIEKERAEREHVEGKLYQVLATSEASRALKDAGFEEPDVMLPHLLPFVDIFVEDGDYVARVVDERGNVRAADGAGTPMTISDLAKSFAEMPKFQGLIKASGTTGGGARNQPGSSGGGRVIIIPKTSSTAEYRRLKAEAEKAGLPYRVGE